MKLRKELILNLILLIMSLSFIMIGAKCTPQWIEFQNLSRMNYILFSIVFLGIGMIFIIKPLKTMIEGIIKENSK